MSLYRPTFAEALAVSQSRGQESKAPLQWNDLQLLLSGVQGDGKTAFDLSGYGNDGVNNGVTWVTSERGRVWEFRGTAAADSIVVQNTAALKTDSFTWTIWVRYFTGAISLHAAFMSMLDGAIGAELVITSDGQLWWATTNKFEVNGTSFVFTSGEWAHIAFCSDATTGVTVFANGDVIDIDATAGGAMVWDGDQMMFGLRENGLPFAFKGQLDLPQVYSRSLSHAEVKQLFESQYDLITPKSTTIISVGDVAVTDRYFLTGDPTTTSAWSETSGGASGASVPGATNDVFFDNANNCTLGANVSWKSLVMTGYTGTFNGAGFNVTTADAENQTLAGTVTMGSGDWSTTNGTFDHSDVTSLTSSGRVILTGTCPWIGEVNYHLNDVTISAGGETTIPTASGDIQFDGTLQIDGDLLVESPRTLSAAGGRLRTGAASRLGGDGSFAIYNVGSGDGYTSRDAGTTIDIANFAMRPIATSPAFPPGVYDSAVLIYNTQNTDAILTPEAGAFTFGSFELENQHGDGSIEIDNVDVTAITHLGDVIRDLQDGTITYTKGSGTMLFSGGENHSIDFGGQDIEAVTFDKTGGNTTLVSGFNPVSFTGTSTGTGTFDFNAQTVVSGGNLSLAADFVIIDNAGAMNGTAWTIPGDFTCDGQSFRANAPWTIAVGGSAVASGSGYVEQSNALGGTRIEAVDWTNGGDNSNWFFGFVPYPHIAGMTGGIAT